jgi:hypothetical protein
LPSISREFKELFDYVAESQLAIPNYLKGKHCAEFTYVANLAKLFLRHGNNMKITGVVNLPILIAHVQNHVVENLGTNQERLRLYDVGDSWFLSDGISEVHHWRCCDNCINNKPLYLLMFGVMRDIRTQKNSRLSVDISLPVRESSDEELTSPLQDELLKFVESIERECVSVSLSRSGSSSVMLESPSPQVSSRRSSSRFDFSGTPQRLFSPASQLCSPIYLENGRPTEGFVSPSTVPFSSFSPSVSSFVSAVDTAKNLSSSESTPVSLLRARK